MEKKLARHVQSMEWNTHVEKVFYLYVYRNIMYYGDLFFYPDKSMAFLPVADIKIRGT